MFHFYNMARTFRIKLAKKLIRVLIVALLLVFTNSSNSSLGLICY